MTKKPRKGKKGAKPQMDVTQPMESNVGEDPAQTIAAPAQKDVAAIRAEEEKVALKWDVGDVILDLYEVKHIHPTGGMGLVYRVHHRGWDIDLAVKSPREEYFQTEQQKENFRKECESWIDLGLHPNIVSCYYVRNLGGIPRVFAEYMDGGSLRDWIEDGRLYEGDQEQALERILDIAIQFAWGLHYTHEQDLVHQDVKPANILMGQEGAAKVKITDFGLARARAMTAESGVWSGQSGSTVTYAGLTPAYCSPEQANKEKLTHKTDIWSWAVSILEMFTGEAYWQAGQAANEVLCTHMETGTDNEAIPKMPKELEQLLRKCFQRDPEDRPDDMMEIAEELKEIYAQECKSEYPRIEPKPAELLADGLNNRAISLLDLGKKEEAEHLWNQAVERYKGHPESVYNRALLSWRSGRTTDVEVLREFQDTCRTLRDDRAAHPLLAHIHLERDDCQSAVEVLSNVQHTKEQLKATDTEVELIRGSLPNSRSLIHEMRGHATGVSSVCFGTDDRYALSGTYHELRLWDLHTRKCLQVCAEEDACHLRSLYYDSRTKVALSGGYKAIKLWDMTSGRRFASLEGGTAPLAVAANGQLAVSGCGLACAALMFWDIVQRKPRWRCETLGLLRAVSITPNGKYALSAEGNKILRLWNVESGRCLKTLGKERDWDEGDWYKAVCLSPDGKCALAGDDGSGAIDFWDLESGRCVRKLTGHMLHLSAVTLVNSMRYAVSGSLDGTLRIWDLSTGRCLRSFWLGCSLPIQDNYGCGHDNAIKAIAVSPSGRYALTGGESKSVALWRVNLDQQWIRQPFAVCRPTETYSALASEQRYDHAIKQARSARQKSDISTGIHWLHIARAEPSRRRDPDAANEWSKFYRCAWKTRVNTAWQVMELGAPKESMGSVSISRNGRRVLLQRRRDSSAVIVLDTATGRCLQAFESDIPSGMRFQSGKHVSFGLFDRQIFTVSTVAIRLFDVRTGKQLLNLAARDDPFQAGVLSPDGRYILSLSFEFRGDVQRLELWSAETGHRLLVLEEESGKNDSIALCRDSRWAVASNETELVAWDLATGKSVHAFGGNKGYRYGYFALSGSSRVLCAAYDDEDSFLFGGARRMVSWNMKTKMCVHDFVGVHEKSISCVCMSLDGRHVISGSGSTAKLWDVRSSECLWMFVGHSSELDSVALSLDGRYLVTSGLDGARLWFLDWDLEVRPPAEWDEDALPYLENFLTLHTPYAGNLPKDREPTEKEVTLAHTRRGKPEWTDEDFQQLLYTLGCAGYGWLRPVGVRKKLEEMAADWEGPPALPFEE